MHPSDRIAALYEENAATWAAARRGAFVERGWIDRFVAHVPQGGAILDLGCGAGEPIASHLVAKGLAVTGVDTAPSLIALCRERMPKQRWIVADMTTLRLGERFDGILAWDSVFHLTTDRQQHMFGIFAAHAAPGATLLFTSGPAAGEAIGRWQGEPLYHASLDPAEYRALLAAHGFAVVEHAAEDPDCGGRTLWLARRA